MFSGTIHDTEGLLITLESKRIRRETSHAHAETENAVYDERTKAAPCDFILSKSVINCSTRGLTQMAETPVYFNHALLRHIDTGSNGTK